MRREDDTETHEIADGAVDLVPFYQRTKRNAEVAIISAAIAILVAVPATAIGLNVRGPKQEIEATNRRIDTTAVQIAAIKKTLDSLLLAARDQGRDIRTLTILSCITARRANRDIATAGGC